jgi:membrane-bound lytic murein transglycosylase F
MKRSNRRQLPYLLAISTVMLSLLGASPIANESITEPIEPSTLRIITKSSPTTFFEGKHGPDGMEFQIIKAFAKQHQYKLELILTDNADDIYNALDQGIADIALLGRPLSITKQDSYPKTPSYMDVTSQLIYKAGAHKPLSFNDMAGKKVVVNDNEQNRKKYRLLKSYFGNLEWEFSNKPVSSLLALVNKGVIDYTITDSHTYLMKRSGFTNTRIAFDLYYPEPISLIYSKQSSIRLQKRLDTFITQATTNGTIEYLMERFYGHADDFDNKYYRSFSFLMRNRLPIYEQAIKNTAKKFDLDWRLLAAIAYQESHWDPDARSRTGVRGMMMLTNNAAIDMGIEDRVDLTQSLYGGAKYFKTIYNQIPDSVQEPDRTWFALAAYNVGLGHLLDGLEITRFHDGNPDLWVDVQKHLPLLAKKEWHQFTRYGHARGNEPVKYVQNIRRYYDILEAHFPLKYNEKFDGESSLVVYSLDDVIQNKRLKVAKTENELHITGLFF